MPKSNAQIINKILNRRVVNVYVKKDMEKALKGKKRLRGYLGVDPTGSRLHIGHAVVLHKFRELQDAGHEMILLVGNFTAKIGDPTDRNAMRKPMTDEEIEANFKDYKKQASKIIDFENKGNPVKMKYNADWLAKMSFADVVKLAANFTVQQNLERDMYQRRIKAEKPIGLHEFLYPLMQGYDSVAMDVDLEIGGNDQTFNMLAGRELQKHYNNKDKFVITTELLEGTDGRKMSKTYNNCIYLDDSPKEMFGKAMSIKDDLIPQFLELASTFNEDEIKDLNKKLKKGENPRDIKFELAKNLVSFYHDEKKAKEAQQEFIKIFSKKELPSDIKDHKVSNKAINLIDLLFEGKLASSKSEARRLLKQGAIRIDQEKVEGDFDLEIEPTDGMILQAGKRKFLRLKVKG